MSTTSLNDFFNFNVFISYKSQQESWAIRLANTLREFGLKVWRDHDADEGGIRLGESWSDEIKRGIRDSEKMIVLWSDLIASNASTVVHQEISEMHTYIQNDKTGRRGYVPLSLDGTSFSSYHPLSAYQGDDVNLKALHSIYGDDGAEQVSAIEWYEALKPLVEALGLDDVMEIRFVVAAMTRQQATELRDDATKQVNPEAFSLMLDVMNKTSSFDVSRYGNSPDDWKPFPQLEQSWTVKEIVEAYDQEKRLWLYEKRKPAKWIIVSYSDEIVANDPEDRRNARKALQDIPCLVIIDPVSIMHRDVFNQIIVDSGLQHHPKAYFIGIAPFISMMHNEMYMQVYEVMQTLRSDGFLKAAYERFSTFFEPYERAFVMDIENQYQFMRWLQVAADNIVSAKQTPMRSHRVRGGMHPSHRKPFGSKRPTPPSTIIQLMMSQKGN